MNRQEWLKGLHGGRPSEFPRWREIEPDGGWNEWWDEDGLFGCIEWPDDDGQVEAGQESLS